jgi:hypothetical protein
MMEAANTSETLVNFYQTTRRNKPEDSHLHTRRRENLKSHIIYSPRMAILPRMLYNIYSWNKVTKEGLT